VLHSLYYFLLLILFIIRYRILFCYSFINIFLFFSGGDALHLVIVFLYDGGVRFCLFNFQKFTKTFFFFFCKFLKKKDFVSYTPLKYISSTVQLHPGHQVFSGNFEHKKSEPYWGSAFFLNNIFFRIIRITIKPKRKPTYFNCWMNFGFFHIFYTKLQKKI